MKLVQVGSFAMYFSEPGVMLAAVSTVAATVGTVGLMVIGIPEGPPLPLQTPVRLQTWPVGMGLDGARSSAASSCCGAALLPLALDGRDGSQIGLAANPS